MSRTVVPRVVAGAEKEEVKGGSSGKSLTTGSMRGAVAALELLELEGPIVVTTGGTGEEAAPVGGATRRQSA
jgi:hypothetical protein